MTAPTSFVLLLGAYLVHCGLSTWTPPVARDGLEGYLVRRAESSSRLETIRDALSSLELLRKEPPVGIDRTAMCAKTKEIHVRTGNKAELADLARHAQLERMLGCGAPLVGTKDLDRLFARSMPPRDLYHWLQAAASIDHPTASRTKSSWVGIDDIDGLGLDEKVHVLIVMAEMGMNVTVDPRIIAVAANEGLASESPDSPLRSKFLSAVLRLGLTDALGQPRLEALLAESHNDLRGPDVSRIEASLKALQSLRANGRYVWPVVHVRKCEEGTADAGDSVCLGVKGMVGDEDLSHLVTLSVESGRCQNGELRKSDVQLDANRLQIKSAATAERSDGLLCDVDVRVAARSPDVVPLFDTQTVAVAFPRSVVVRGVEVEVLGSLDVESRSRRVTAEFGQNLSSLVNGELKKVAIWFTLQNTGTKKSASAHQVFVNFVHADTLRTVTFVSERDSQLRYSCEIDVGSVAGDAFGFLSGAYTMNLLVGDSSLARPLSWNMGVVALRFSKESTVSSRASRGPLPEMTNVPKPRPKQPHKVISVLFTGLVLLLGGMVPVLWRRSGLELSVKVSPWRVVFAVASAGLCYTLYRYWRDLNGFEALRIYAPLAALACLSLNYVLNTDVEI